MNYQIERRTMSNGEANGFNVRDEEGNLVAEVYKGRDRHRKAITIQIRYDIGPIPRRHETTRTLAYFKKQWRTS